MCLKCMPDIGQNELSLKCKNAFDNYDETMVCTGQNFKTVTDFSEGMFFMALNT